MGGGNVARFPVRNLQKMEINVYCLNRIIYTPYNDNIALNFLVPKASRDFNIEATCIKKCAWILEITFNSPCDPVGFLADDITMGSNLHEEKLDSSLC